MLLLENNSLSLKMHKKQTEYTVLRLGNSRLYNIFLVVKI